MKINVESKIEIFQELLELYNPNWKSDPDMRETPDRYIRMLDHFFRGYRKSEMEHQLSKVFPTTNDQMVIVKNIECFGMCPHHLVPIVYKVSIGYIPNGKAIGLSKLARLAVMLSATPKLQENFTSEIANMLEERLLPLGVMVIVEGVHGCMRTRGVEQNSTCITSDCRGVLREKAEAREEFLKLIK